MEVTNREANRNWDATFCCEPEGEGSLEFLRKVAIIAISQIFYSRGLIAKRYFKERRIGALKIHVVSRSNGGGRIVADIKSILEAIHLGYARDLVIVISDARSKDRNETLETYRISFAYEMDKPQGIITGKQNETAYVPAYKNKVETQKQLFHMIRRINALAHVLGPFSHEVCSSFKLTYYDERTPEDYEPEGFETEENELFHYRKNLGSIDIARLDCQKHMIALSVRSILIENPSLVEIDIARVYASIAHDENSFGKKRGNTSKRAIAIESDPYNNMNDDNTSRENVKIGTSKKRISLTKKAY